MKNTIQKFDEASACLAPILRTRVLKLPDSLKADVREIRLNAGVPVMLVCSHGVMTVGSDGNASYINSSDFPKVSPADIRETLSICCGYSLHSCQDSLIEGYVTVKGGHRVGIGSRAVVEEGRIKGIKDVSFLNIRIARQAVGSAQMIYEKIFSNGLQSVVIAGAPSTGKTTLLRDLSRLLSDFGANRSYRTCIIDERDEIAAMFNGQAQNSVGANSCVLSGFPKSQAILRAVRSLSPQIILCDEIGGNDEIEAVKQGLNSGVKFVVTVHSGSEDELLHKVQMRELVKTGVFKYAVLLSENSLPCTVKKIYKIEELFG